MSDRNNRVCPVERAGSLDNRIRRWFQNPQKILRPYIEEGMLQKVRDKIKGTEFEERIKLHKCEENKIGISDYVDFVLLFYIVHEVPNKDKFFDEIGTILKPNGQVLIVEPPFHVSRLAFEETIKKARDVGFTDTEGPNMLFHKTAILRKG